MWKPLIAFALLPTIAFAECPPGQDRSDERAALQTQLLNAANELAAQRIANDIWKIWLSAPDARAQALLDLGMEHRRVFSLEDSEDVLDQLITYCPTYTEGYNQRAFTRFLRTRFDEALADIEVVLSRDPYHFGALSGKALTLMRQGRTQLAQDTLRRAIQVHPFLRERSMIVDDGKDPI